jgi:hypothetical protein
METDPETLGIVVEGHFHGAVLMGHGQATGEMTTELGEGCEEEPGGLPEAVGKGPRAVLLRGRKGYPRRWVKPRRCAHPRGTPRIA